MKLNPCCEQLQNEVPIDDARNGHRFICTCTINWMYFFDNKQGWVWEMIPPDQIHSREEGSGMDLYQEIVKAIHSVRDPNGMQTVVHLGAARAVAPVVLNLINDRVAKMKEALDCLPLEHFEKYLNGEGGDPDAAEFVDHADSFMQAMEKAKAISNS